MAALVSNNDGGIPLEEFPLGFDTGGYNSLHDLTLSFVYVVTAFLWCMFLPWTVEHWN